MMGFANLRLEIEGIDWVEKESAQGFQLNHSQAYSQRRHFQRGPLREVKARPAVSLLAVPTDRRKHRSHAAG